MKRIDPSVIARLPALQLRARQVVEGLHAGLHSAPYHGHSQEFSQHREYTAGDPLRSIDWKVYGRTDRFYVKQYQDETNLRAYLLLDSSHSMEYAHQGRPPKLSFAVNLAAAFAYLLMKQQDAVALGVFDTTLRTWLPPQHHAAHLAVFFDALEQVVAGGETAIPAMLTAFGSRLKKRGMIVIISDLMDTPAAVLAAVRALRARHHEVMVVQVLDPDEIAFPFTGEIRFTDLESSAACVLDADEAGETYRRLMAGFLQEYAAGFRHAGIDYHRITTDTPLEQALSRIIRGRE
jgi:uncharacterized protein (DUF58 family)